MIILGTNSIKDTGYNVDNSLRFNSGSSDYLNRTQSGAGNRKTFTFSVWLKMALDDVASDIGILSYYSNDNNFGKIGIQGDNNQFVIVNRTSGTFNTNVQISAMARDISAWSHLVVAVDTTQSTDSNRIKFYVNGTQQTSFVSSTYPSQNTDLEFNTTHSNYVSNWNGSSQHFDGYMTEVVFIDGQQLDATSFGEFDEDSGIWKPIDVSGLTFGTNGFYLDFENSGSLGADVSGNGNNFTVNNLTSIDQSSDSCTNNFATINILTPVDTTVSEGNLKYSDTNSNFKGVVGTFGASSGKWYYEVKIVTVGDAHHVGIVDIDQQQGAVAETPGSQSNGYSLSNERDVYNNNGILSGYTDWTGTYGNGDIMGIAMDLDNNKLYFSKGGQWSAGDGTWGSTTFNASTAPITINSGVTYTFSTSAYNGTGEINFGSPSFTISSGNTDADGYGNFEYAVPSGYYSLNTKNLAEYG